MYKWTFISYTPRLTNKHIYSTPIHHYMKDKNDVEEMSNKHIQSHTRMQNVHKSSTCWYILRYLVRPEARATGCNPKTCWKASPFSSPKIKHVHLIVSIIMIIYILYYPMILSFHHISSNHPLYTNNKHIHRMSSPCRRTSRRRSSCTSCEALGPTVTRSPLEFWVLNWMGSWVRARWCRWKNYLVEGSRDFWRSVDCTPSLFYSVYWPRPWPFELKISTSFRAESKRAHR